MNKLLETYVILIKEYSTNSISNHMILYSADFIKKQLKMEIGITKEDILDAFVQLNKVVSCSPGDKSRVLANSIDFLKKLYKLNDSVGMDIK